MTTLLRGDNVSDFLALRKSGLSISEISRLTGFNRRTVRKYLQQPSIPEYKPRAPQPSKLDPHKPYLQQRLQAGVWNGVVLLRELQERGYEGGYSILKDYLRPLREEARGRAVRRFETPPGLQAQVDWGDVGDLCFPDAPKQSLSGFLMTLGYSRALFADITTDQTLVTFLHLHEEAFAFLGGVPQEILYDRVKTVVLGIDERQEIVWHPVFRDFARYWGFIPRLCHAYRPQTKGKVERGVRYLRQSFLCGREAKSLDELRTQLRRWLSEVANARVHGTTRQIVREAWEQEKPHLQSLANRSTYPYLPEQARRVSRDAYVCYQTNRYSVPWHAAGQEVSLREVAGQVQIWRGGEQLCAHDLCLERFQTITLAAHHVGIPLGPNRRAGAKAKVTIYADVPDVQVRSLDVYEAFCQVPGDTRSVEGNPQ